MLYNIAMTCDEITKWTPLCHKKIQILGATLYVWFKPAKPDWVLFYKKKLLCKNVTKEIKDISLSRLVYLDEKSFVSEL